MQLIRISGDPALDWIIVIFVVGTCIYWSRAFHLAREGVGFFVQNLAHASLVFIVLALVLLGEVRGQTNMQQEKQQRVVFAGLVASVFLIVRQGKKRPRHIPRSIRKAVIARDLKGARFNPRRHHVDHVWPFSKGGSHTLDNLRVVDKKENLKKGSKRPRLRDMW